MFLRQWSALRPNHKLTYWGIQFWRQLRTNSWLCQSQSNCKSNEVSKPIPSYQSSVYIISFLGRLWIHHHKVDHSNYHQCLKATWKEWRVHVNAMESPFKLVEAHIFEVPFFNELAKDIEVTLSYPESVPLPTWEDPKEQDPGLIMLLKTFSTSSTTKPTSTK